MAHVEVKKIVEAPLADLWVSWDDFANIHKFHPGLTDSYLLEGSGKTWWPGDLSHQVAGMPADARSHFLLADETNL